MMNYFVCMLVAKPCKYRLLAGFSSCSERCGLLPVMADYCAPSSVREEVPDGIPYS